VKGLHLAENARAVAAGLTFRPLEETARDTLAHAALTDEAGMKPERERELLAEWASLASGA
jgi:2'-hydroxyisoflavone reductase